MSKYIIIGGKGTAVVIAEQILDAIHKYNAKHEVLGFAFDDESFGEEINGLPIIDKTYNIYEKFKQYNDIKFIFSMYRYDLIKERIKLRESYNIPLHRYATFIHPTATITRSAELGIGNIILANTVISPNAKIGNFNTFNSNSFIAHDCIIGDNNFMASHTVIGSYSKIGKGNFFGLSSSVRDSTQIENYNIIGIASNVIKDITSENNVLVGNPAKIFSKKNLPH